MVVALTPVHVLAVAPDASLAVVAGDRGHYFLLDRDRGDTLREGRPLPIEGVHYITDVQVPDANTIALSVLRRGGNAPSGGWSGGTFVVVDRGGQFLAQRDFDFRGAPSIPAIDVAPGDRSVLGFTNDTAILLKLSR